MGSQQSKLEAARDDIDGGMAGTSEGPLQDPQRRRSKRALP